MESRKAPSRTKLIDDKWIRNADALGDALILDTQEYMMHGERVFCIGS